MPKSLSIATLIATVIGILLVIGAIAYGAAGYRSFISLEGLLIVVGGTVANAFMSYQKEDVFKAFATIRRMLDKPQVTRDGIHRDITQMIRWSYILQAEDLVGLEREAARQIRDPLLRYGMDLVVSGYPADKIRDMMQTVADAEFERRSVPVTVLRNMAATAPAFGMVGTLVGMVTLLNSVGAELTTVGGGLAIAMLSTLYGILAARLVCLPAADKLQQKEENAHFRNYMVSEGFALLGEKNKPFYVQDKLNSFLEPTKHIDFHNSVHRHARRPVAWAA